MTPAIAGPVTSLQPDADGNVLHTATGARTRARSIVLATGAATALLRCHQVTTSPRWLVLKGFRPPERLHYRVDYVRAPDSNYRLEQRRESSHL